MNTTETHTNYVDSLAQAAAKAQRIEASVRALKVNYDRLRELQEEFAADKDEDGSSALYYQECRRELAVLELQSCGCTSYDEALEQLLNSALDVTVRSGWEAPGNLSRAEEFQILLCTGGSAVRIMGKLDIDGEPVHAWIEHQDWGTPWTFSDHAIDQETLLTYCKQFYFGESE